MTATKDGLDESIVGSVLALCGQTAGAHRVSGPKGWRDELRQLKRSGFSRVDLLDSWLPFGSLTTSQIDDLASILVELDLTAPCLGTSRRSLLDPEHGAANLDYTLRIVEVAAQLGLHRVGVGFHPALMDVQKKTTAFWEYRGPADDRTDQNWSLAAEQLGVVCDFAASLKIDVNIELYEDSLFSTSYDADRLASTVARENFGFNPDLGNIIRSATPLREPWLETFRACLPHMTYWHLKNYSRSSPTPEGPFAVAPTTLGEGAIDYRLAVREAISAGYTGPFIVEHYGGDALWIQEQGRRYLERLIRDVQEDELEIQR